MQITYPTSSLPKLSLGDDLLVLLGAASDCFDAEPTLELCGGSSGWYNHRLWVTNRSDPSGERRAWMREEEMDEQLGCGTHWEYSVLDGQCVDVSPFPVGFDTLIHPYGL